MKIPVIKDRDNLEMLADFITKFSIQGMEIKLSGISPASMSAHDNLGWDITNVNQLCFLKDSVLLLKGNFKSAEFRKNNDKYLLQIKSDNYGYTYFYMEDLGLYLALKEPFLLICNERKILDILINLKENSGKNISNNMSFKKFLPNMVAFHGLYIAGSGNVEAKNTGNNQIDQLLSMYKSSYGWDKLTFALNFSNERTLIQCQYQYPSNDEALKDKDLIIKTLTETRSHYYENKRWSDLVQIKKTDIKNGIVSVSLLTEYNRLLPMVFEVWDFFGLLPIRTVKQ